MDENGMDGYAAWMVLPFAFMGQVLSVGLLYCYGIINVELTTFHGVSEITSASIGSIGYSVCFAVGIVTSTLCNRFGCGVMMTIGGFLSALGILSSSFVHDAKYLFLTYGVITSMGLSCLYFSSFLVIPLYFKKRLIIASGLVSAGSSVGCIVLSPVISYMITEYGLNLTFQLYSILYVIPIFSGILLKRKRYSKKEKPSLSSILDRSLTRNNSFLIFVIAMCIFLFIYYVPYIYLNKYAEYRGVNLTESSYLQSIIAVSSLLGKISYSTIALCFKVNRLYMFQLSTLAMSVAITLMSLTTNFSQLAVFAGFHGFFDGGFSCFTLVITNYLILPHQLDLAFGFMFTITSLFSIAGPPFAAFLIEVTDSYEISFMLCGGILLSGVLLLFLIPFFIPKDVYKERKRLKHFNVSAVTSESKVTGGKIVQHGRNSIAIMNDDLYYYSRECDISAGTMLSEYNEKPVLSRLLDSYINIPDMENDFYISQIPPFCVTDYIDTYIIVDEISVV